MTGLVALVLLFGGGPAWAQCDEASSNESFARGVDAAQHELDSADLMEVKRQLQDVGTSLLCLDERVDRQVLAHFAQLMALSFFFDQDGDQAERWGLMARAIDPQQAWQAPADHPLPELIASLDEPPLGRADGQRLDPPKKGAIFLNGELALEPIAQGEVPYLVQVFDGSGQVVGAYWQDGAAFPPSVLADGEGATTAPRWYRGPVMRPADDRVASQPGGTRRGGDMPVVPLAISGGLVATSALSYFLAGSIAASIPDRTTSEGLTSARSGANALVLVSGVTLAGAVGIGAGAVFTNGRTVGWHLRF